MKPKKLFFYFALPLLFSCNSGEKHIKSLTAANQLLKDSIENLKDSLGNTLEELENYKNSPEILCVNIEKLKSSNDTIALLSIKEKLERYHPESNKVKVVGDIIRQIKLSAKKKSDEEKKNRLTAFSKLRKRHDSVQNVTWCYNPYFNHYDNITGTSIYMGKTKSAVWLNLKMSYGGEDWIFFDRAYLSYDGNTMCIEFDEYEDKTSDNDGYGVGEWIDIRAKKEVLSFLRSMVNGKKVEMQFRGKYAKTKTLSANEIKGIKAVLLAYDTLKEEPDIMALNEIFDN